MKDLSIRLTEVEDAELTINKSGTGVVKAGDIELPNGVEVINPDHHIATLNEEGSLSMTMRVTRGRGFCSGQSLG